MDVRVCQHVPFEGPGAITDWALDRGHDVAVTRLDRGESLPAPDGADLYVVLGGPMSVDDVEEYPWLGAERDFIRHALAADRAVLGVCLGAQQLARALGAAVQTHDHTEIGWFPVEATGVASDTVFGALPETYPAFHWHGDRFAVPDGATLTATSEGCPTQAFVARDGRAVGIQFHLEATPESVRTLVDAAGVPESGPWVQDRDAVLDEDAPYDALRDCLYQLLDEIADNTT